MQVNSENSIPKTALARRSPDAGMLFASVKLRNALPLRAETACPENTPLKW